MASRPPAGAVTEEGTPPEDAAVALAEAVAGIAPAAEKPDGGAAMASSADEDVSPAAETEKLKARAAAGAILTHLSLAFLLTFCSLFAHSYLNLRPTYGLTFGESWRNRV